MVRNLTLSIAALAAVSMSQTGTAYADQLFGPSHYRCFDAGELSGANATGCAGADSAFRNIPFTEFSFEDFEDSSFVSGVDFNGAFRITSETGRVNTDSVDIDDGVIDGSGTIGGSLFIGGGQDLVLTFTGDLPTHVGAVFTDGRGNTAHEMQFFDVNGTLLGAAFSSPTEPGNDGDTAEDTFIGYAFAGGIASLVVVNPGETSGGIEIDHLQFGTAPLVVAAPPSISLMILAAMPLIRRYEQQARQKRPRHC